MFHIVTPDKIIQDKQTGDGDQHFTGNRNVNSVVIMVQHKSELDITEVQQDENDIIYNDDYVFKPMHTCFRLVGCMHHRPIQVQDGAKKKLKPTVTFIYSVFVLIATWLNVVRFFFAFSKDDKFGGVLFSKLVSLTWFIQCALTVTACFVASYRNDRLPKFFKVFLDIKRNDDEWPERWRVVRKKAAGFSIFCTLLVLLNVGYLSYGLFDTEVFDVWLMPLDPTYIARVFSVLLGALLSGIWIFALCLVYSSCAILVREFDRFNQELYNAIRPDGELVGDLAYFRRKHQRICRLTGIADNCMYMLNGITVMANVIIICVGIYSLVFYQDVFTSSPVALTDVLYKIVFSVIMFACLLYGGANVNTKAHEPLHILYNVDMQKLSPENQYEMSVFVHRMNGPPIGLSVASMFVINKATILTFGGIIMTYFVVLVEFKPNFDVVDAICNLTALVENGTISILSP